MLSLDQLHKRFEEFRDEYVIGAEPEGLYAPVDYIMNLGGKRMRPLLVLCAYQMYSDDIQRVLPAALGVEVLHNYTLVHDDIMDSASMRRGQLSVHKKYNTNAAILSGDVMLIRSFDMILESCVKEASFEPLRLMFDTSREICEGQQLDMDFEVRSDVDVKEYLLMIKYKTAVLLSACLKLGAMLAGAPHEACHKLYEAGLLFGKAFQMQDDLLDAFGDSENTGKRRGGDIVNSKKTYLYALTLQKLPGRRRDSFIEMYNAAASNPEVKIQKVLRVFEEFDIESEVIEDIEEVYHEGVRMIDSLVVNHEVAKLPLMDIVRKLRVRVD